MNSEFGRHQYCWAIQDKDDKWYVCDREPYAYDKAVETRKHIVSAQDTWWGLAGIYYPNIERGCGLFWVLADFQGDPVIDPTLRLKTGSTVLIPSESWVKENIFDADRRLLV